MFNILQLSDNFPLWGFSTDSGVMVTRGRTQDEALYHISLDAEPLDHLPIDMAEVYLINHAPGWINRPPYWLCEHLGENPRDHGHIDWEERARDLADELGITY